MKKLAIILGLALMLVLWVFAPAQAATTTTYNLKRLSDFTNHEGVKENNTAFHAAQPSLEFHRPSAFAEKVIDAMNSTGTIQFDAYFIISSASNELHIYFIATGTGAALQKDNQVFFKLEGNTTVALCEYYDGALTATNYDITYDFALNQWTQLRIKNDGNNWTLYVGANTFTMSAHAIDVTKVKIYATGPAGESGIMTNSVFVDDALLQYKPSLLAIAASWWDEIVGSEYFPVVLILIFGGVVIAIIKRLT